MSESKTSFKGLILDDSKLIRNLEKVSMREAGVTNVDETKNCAEALEKLGAAKYDIAILDWTLDDGPGVNVLKAIRDGDGPNKKTCVLMVTAMDSRENVLAAAKLGISGYVVKPFTTDALGAKIKSLLAK